MDCYPQPMQYLDVLAQVADPSSGTDPWWKVVGGLLAIPTAIIGLFVSFPLIKKSRLESRKIELEIAEKEAALKSIKSDTGASGQASGDGQLTALVAPLLEGRRVQEIVLRFVVLYLTVQAWSMVDRLFEFGAGASISFFIRGTDSTVQAIGYGIYGMVAQIPQAGLYIMVLGLGGPIFIDCLRHLNIRIPKFIAGLESPKPIAYVAIAAVFLLMGAFIGIR